MAGKIGRPPYTGVGRGMRWQGDGVGFYGGLAGICGECLSSAETVGGVSCSAQLGERQVAEGAVSNCRYRNLSARSPDWASGVLSWAPSIHCDMDGAGNCRAMMMLPLSKVSVAMGERQNNPLFAAQPSQRHDAQNTAPVLLLLRHHA